MPDLCAHTIRATGFCSFRRAHRHGQPGLLTLVSFCGATTPTAQLADAEGGNDSDRLFLSPNKTGEACASPVVKVSELRLWWTADPPRPFLTSPGSAFVLPFGCQSRVFLPPFFIDAFASISRVRRRPLESPLWYDRFFWQNPVRVTRPVPPGHRRFLPPSYRPVVSLSVLSRSEDRFRPSVDSVLSVGGFRSTG